jgi:peroxiredoxin
MNRRQILLFAASALAGLPVRAASPAPQFEVLDTSLRKRRLDEFKGKTVVLEWTSASCPYVRAQYESGVMPDLQRWAGTQGIVWLSIISTHPSRRDYLPPDKAEALHRARGAAPAALLMDSAGTVGRVYGAVVTPHMFVIDAKGELAYSGAISDNPTTRASEARAARNYVRAALEDLAAGRKVATSSTRPFGCTIAYSGD